MNTPTDRQSFREVVAMVAERARAILPQAVNGRVESAVKLVLFGDVQPQADGRILVGSSSDPTRTYTLVGHACECQDFTSGKAPEGWCQHRTAAGIWKRVQELLPSAPVVGEVPPETDEGWPPEEATAAVAPTPTTLPEAPCSVNAHVTIAGRQVQITLRGTDEAAVLTRLEAVLARYPQPQAAVPQDHGKGWCHAHHVPMQWNEGKDGRTGWYSHKQDDGGWCHGRRR